MEKGRRHVFKATLFFSKQLEFLRTSNNKINVKNFSTPDLTLQVFTWFPVHMCGLLLCNIQQ